MCRSLPAPLLPRERVCDARADFPFQPLPATLAFSPLMPVARFSEKDSPGIMMFI